MIRNSPPGTRISAFNPACRELCDRKAATSVNRASAESRIRGALSSSIHAGTKRTSQRARSSRISLASPVESFERQVYAAQSVDAVAGELTAPGAPPGLGPEALHSGAPARLGNNPINRIFGSFAMWQQPAADARVGADLKAGADSQPGTDQSVQRARRESIARGADVFYLRRFLISDVGKYNDKGLGNPFKRSCGSGCHNTLLMGMDLAPGYMDLGLNNLPWANARPDLPLFKVVCESGAVPQSYLGRVMFTHDPGRALITGKCADVGASMTQQSRSLAARAPYFMNGSAANLRELVDFYDRRFNIGYTETEKQDLVNFLSVL